MAEPGSTIFWNCPSFVN